jgi:transposase
MDDFATSGATSAPVPRRLEVLSGPERRRRHSDDEKAALVAETFRPGVCTADLARRHGLHPQQLYTWRRQARRGELALRDEDLPMFAPVVAAEPAAVETAPQSADDHLLVLEVGEVRLRIGSAVAPERVAALVSALRAG